MRIGSFSYLLRQGTRNTYVNKAMSIASVGVLTACLVLVGLAVLFSENIKSIIGFVQQQNEIVVYVSDDITPEQESNLDKQLRSMSNVSKVSYTSKEQAFENQSKKLGDLLKGYENEDVYPASYHITIKDLSKMENDVGTVSAIAGVYRVDAPTDVAQVMVKTNNIVSIGGSVITIILLVVSFVIIINTIRITVFSRRREINIMKYVGATNGFIRMPFLVEGIILGFVSAVLAFFIVWYFYSQIIIALQGDKSVWISSATASLIPFSDVFVRLLLGYILVGTLIGGIGSLASIRKHLRV